MTILEGRPRSAWALIVGMAFLAACATSGSSVEVASEATGSSYFSLGRPAVYRVASGLQLTGRVCRRARTTLLSPHGVRLEHIAAAGAIVESARAYVPAISRRADQACGVYAARVAWSLADGDGVRACFDRGRPCPATPETKTIVAAPAPGA